MVLLLDRTSFTSKGGFKCGWVEPEKVPAKTCYFWVDWGNCPTLSLALDKELFGIYTSTITKNFPSFPLIFVFVLLLIDGHSFHHLLIKVSFWQDPRTFPTLEKAQDRLLVKISNSVKTKEAKSVPDCRQHERQQEAWSFQAMGRREDGSRSKVRSFR